MPRTRSTPWLIILLGIGFLALTGWSIYLAARGASAVTDADYYSHGLRYNQTLLEQKAAVSLGWDAAPEIHDRRVTIQLRDRDQRGVAGAHGTLAILKSGKPQDRILAFTEIGPGIYQAEFPAGTQGEQPVEVTFQRDGASLSKRLLFSLK